MGKQSKQSLVRKLRAAGGKIEALPEAGQIARLFLKKAGGAEGFASQLWGDYQGAPVGSVSRQRIGAAIIEILRREQDRDGGADWDQMTDEEMLAAAQELRLVPGVLDDGDAAAGPAGDTDPPPAEGRPAAAGRPAPPPA